MRAPDSGSSRDGAAARAGLPHRLRWRSERLRARKGSSSARKVGGRQLSPSSSERHDEVSRRNGPSRTVAKKCESEGGSLSSIR